MTESKLLEIISKYKELLRSNGITPAKHDDSMLSIDYKEQLRHCAWMLDQMELMQFEKAQRWLGFLQGVLWSQSIDTIAKLKADNR